MKNLSELQKKKLSGDSVVNIEFVTHVFQNESFHSIIFVLSVFYLFYSHIWLANNGSVVLYSYVLMI